MKNQQLIDRFSEVAKGAGAEIIPVSSVAAAVEFIAGQIKGSLLVPSFSTEKRFGISSALKDAGVNFVNQDLRAVAEQAEGGLTGVSFAIADTGSLVLESTAEDIRLATTLPVKHFALLDPDKIVADGLEAVTPLRQLHQQSPRNYIAYITGPSRTADIERVLTIGVHGPKELYILLVPGFSADYLEM